MWLRPVISGHATPWPSRSTGQSTAYGGPRPQAPRRRSLRLGRFASGASEVGGEDPKVGVRRDGGTPARVLDGEGGSGEEGPAATTGEESYGDFHLAPVLWLLGGGAGPNGATRNPRADGLHGSHS